MTWDKNIWYSIEKDGPPPFDTLVVVRGNVDIIDHTGKNWGKAPHYALAYNDCYRPEVCMNQVIDLPEELKDKLPIYISVPFNIEEWMIL